MVQQMEVLVLVGRKELRIQEQPLPHVEQDEVLIEVAAVGVCGSELGGFLGVNALRQPPLIMGHEASGRIVVSAGGLLADKTEPAVGQKVTFNPLITCGKCSLCLTGRSSLCSERKLIGAHRPGAFARFVAVPAGQCWPLPAGMSLFTGALSEPVACAVRAVARADSSGDELLWIIGAGTIGLSCLAIALDSGIRQVVVSDISAERLSVAELWGAAATVNPYDTSTASFCRRRFGRVPGVIIDAVGSEEVRAEAIRSVSPSGKIVWVGLHDEESKVPCNQIVRNEITLCGSFGYSQDDFQRALSKLSEGVIKVGEDWLQIRSLKEGQRVFEDLVEGRSCSTKILFAPGKQ